ncbi:hypothetical protein DH2020_025254 [Rehmannia glutinosa]|uniref:NAD-dependent epimerase/dehydratase domain-containing protein n=1 Tax=Rehmannia glutinosa TaxID=99300 RepID=A0ABR0W4K1_REHGL
MEESYNKKGRVCVTGGTGYLGSWMVKRLLEDGYFVNTTTRLDPERKRDVSYLTNLPGASERLQIFNADLDEPDSFRPAIEGCIGLFHVAHPIDFEDKETEEIKTKRSITALLGILQACLDSKTVKRVVYTSSLATATFNNSKDVSDLKDETCWTNVEFVWSLGVFGGSYTVSKTLTEKTALEFAEKHGLDVVTVLPSWIHGPFISPACPGSVFVCLKDVYQNLVRNCFVHVDDVARAHIHLFEYPNAKGRYICSGVEATIHELSEIISAKYPECKLPTAAE